MLLETAASIRRNKRANNFNMWKYFWIPGQEWRGVQIFFIFVSIWAAVQGYSSLDDIADSVKERYNLTKLRSAFATEINKKMRRCILTGFNDFHLHLHIWRYLMDVWWIWLIFWFNFWGLSSGLGTPLTLCSDLVWREAAANNGNDNKG